VYVWASGDKYEGDWKSDNKNGSGTHTWHGGGGYIGQYKDGERYGYGKLSIPQNNYDSIESWQNSVVGEGRKDGELVIFEGFFQDEGITLSCTSEDNCQLAKIKLQSEKDRKDTLEQTQPIVNFISLGIFLVATPWIMLRKKLIIFKIISNTASARTILMLIMFWFIAFIQSTFISLNSEFEFEFGFEEVIHLILEPLDYLFEYATEFDVILLIVGYPVLIWIINFIVKRRKNKMT
jgi:hypothetical protein